MPIQKKSGNLLNAPRIYIERKSIADIYISHSFYIFDEYLFLLDKPLAERSPYGREVNASDYHIEVNAFELQF